MIVSEAHDGAFPVIFGDLLEGQIQVLFASGVRWIIRSHLGRFGCHDLVMISEDESENKH